MFAPQTVMQVKKMILEGPESTKDEAEIQMYLLALKNSLLPEAVPILNRFAESEVGSCSTIALTALQRYDVSLINSEVNPSPSQLHILLLFQKARTESRCCCFQVKQTVNRVYHQNLRIYEKNVRAAAADVILSSNPSYMEVKNLLLSIGNLPHEMNKYMLSKIQDILRFEMPARCVKQRQCVRLNKTNVDDMMTRALIFTARSSDKLWRTWSPTTTTALLRLGPRLHSQDLWHVSKNTTKNTFLQNLGHVYLNISFIRKSFWQGCEVINLTACIIKNYVLPLKCLNTFCYLTPFCVHMTLNSHQKKIRQPNMHVGAHVIRPYVRKMLCVL